MGRIASKPKKGWALLRAMLLAFALAGTAMAEDRGDPKLDYVRFAPDEQLTLSGRLVRPDIDARREEATQAEIRRVAASQKYQPRPAIWRIRDADTTIYLFGTVHSLPPGFKWRNPVLEGVVVQADTLILESTEKDGQEVTFLEGTSAQNGGPPLPPLIERASPQFRPKLKELLAVLPPDAASGLDRMPTWIAAMGIGYLRDLMIGDMPSQGADDWLEQHFRATGRPVEAIEDSKAVVSNINAIPEDAQRMMLDAALAAPDRTHAELDAPAHAWAQGNVGYDSPLRVFADQLDPSSAMADPLLIQRNTAWVDSLIARLAAKPGVVLFAAGAGHFVGPGSVIDLLQKRGLRVERVQ
ncbi:TraB/GumN family protein [Sphingomonas sp. LB-2]|uniref:TraB/GumN family protein n=1 Tax=Sphingomonas caeni TaxID=2984949 RepID=UPI00222E7E59|nr:TraB/GumN family protein [Sphingomonas caeni]MCW3848946.1 TraB/GumN family protein [Sphingomonas caeni]